MNNLVPVTFQLGLMYCVVLFGVFLNLRVLNFPDLTIGASFVTGAAVAAVLTRVGMPPVISLFGASAGGFLAGTLTAFLHTKVGIGKILSGLISLGMLYTINLRIMGSPNLSLLNLPNILWWLGPSATLLESIIFLIVLVLFLKLSLDWFLHTEIGLFIRAIGDNEKVPMTFAVNPNVIKFIGITVGNALVGFGGGIVAQNQGYADINMGAGVVIFGLAAYLLGQTILSSNKIFFATAAVIIGSITYQFVINIALRIGLAGTDLQLVTSLMVVVAILIRTKWKTNTNETTISRY